MPGRLRWEMTGVARRALAPALAATALAVALLVPVAANAAAVGKATPTFPGAVTVGQIGLPASLTLENRNTPLEAEDTNTVCNAAEAVVPCTTPEQGIVLVPSCGRLSGDMCVAADPGVFSLSATGVGKPATACAGMPFTITVIDPATGTVRFTPQPAGAHVMLAAFGARCEIGFTLNVLRSPILDANPGLSGIQTVQVTQHRQYVGLVGPAAPTVVASGSSTGTTVTTPPPPPLPDFALFTSSPKSLRVSQAGRFTYSFFATPGRKGKARLTSAKAIKIGSKRHKLKVAAKSFKAPTNANVKVTFKLTARNRKALKARTSVKFAVSVTVGVKTFSAKLTLKPPKKS